MKGNDLNIFFRPAKYVLYLNKFLKIMNSFLKSLIRCFHIISLCTCTYYYTISSFFQQSYSSLSSEYRYTVEILAKLFIFPPYYMLRNIVQIHQIGIIFTSVFYKCLMFSSVVADTHCCQSCLQVYLTTVINHRFR